MNQSSFLYYFTDSLNVENLLIYFYCSNPPQSAPIKKNRHTSWQFLVWSPWQVPHLHQLFFILDGLNMSIYTFFKMPLQAPYCIFLYFTLTMWAITCQCSGEQPALARFGSVNSSDDKEHRRSTRWSTPAHFLFKSAPTPGSSKLFPARKGLPVVLCWLWLANSMLWPFPHQECHQAECVARVRGGGGDYMWALIIS